MNLQQLHQALQDANVDSKAYCLNGGLPSEAYTIENSGQTWSIYYSERGIRSGKRDYASEDEACHAFLDWVLKDKTTRRPGT